MTLHRNYLGVGKTLLQLKRKKQKINYAYALYVIHNYF